MHRHFSDAELARYAIDPESMPLQRRQVIEREAASCSICQTSLDFFSVVDLEALEEEELPESAEWRSEDDTIRVHAERIEAEDREADELLEKGKWLESPTRTAWTDLTRDRRMLNGGVVRRLVAHAHEIYENEPLDALTFADAAISIAEALPEHTYPWKAVLELRGAAWKERANALLVAGEFPAALEALTHAEHAYRRLSFPTLGLSSVALIRAGVYGEQDHLDEALIWAEKAEVGFAYIGQEDRRMRAVFVRGSIKHEMRDIGTAILLFEQVLDYGEEAHSPRWIARASYAMGACEIDRQNLGEASLHFHKALVIFREIGPDRERLATEWGLARVVLHGGDQRRGLQRLHAVADELEKRSMITDAALVRLDIVEVLLPFGDIKQITDIAAHSLRVFMDAGVITGALTAMAYLKEAAKAGTLTTAGVNAVRSYLRRSTRQPQLVFEPPPERFP